MDATTPVVESSNLKEIKWVIFWFQTWTPRQRRIFLENLVQKYLPDKVEFLMDSLSNLNMNNQSPSEFECRLRLFRQWFELWPNHTRLFMIERLESCDPSFIQQFYSCLHSSTASVS